MAILAFPSSAIVGNLDWTGASSTLTATDSITATAGNVFQLNCTDGVASSTLMLDTGDGASITSNQYIYLESTSPNPNSGTQILVDPGFIQLFGQSTTNITIQVGTNYITCLDSYVALSANDEQAVIHVDNDGTVGIDCVQARYNSKPIATEPFVAAMAIALG
jgi:hypothetical protein